MQKLIEKLIEEYKDGSDEPLDESEVDVLVSHVKNFINLNEGNITQEKFNKLEGI